MQTNKQFNINVSGSQIACEDNLQLRSDTERLRSSCSEGQGCSCNETWCSLMSKLQSSAEERKNNRRDCSSHRPKCLRFRRRLHKGKCNCKPKCDQETSTNVRSDCGQSLSEPRKKPCQVHFCKASGEPPSKCCSQKSPQNLKSKNICRFTVDAYFN